jgi:hypothetical protein
MDRQAFSDTINLGFRFAVLGFFFCGAIVALLPY